MDHLYAVVRDRTAELEQSVMRPSLWTRLRQLLDR